MSNKIEFPYNGIYTAKKSGYKWHYQVYQDGFIAWVERYCNINGYTKSKKGTITKELLNDIELKTGKRTDGWRWVKEDK